MPEVLIPENLSDSVGQAQRESILASLPKTLQQSLARQSTQYCDAAELDRVEAWLLAQLESDRPLKFDQYPPWAMLASSAAEDVPRDYCRWWGTVGHIKIERDGVRLLPGDVLNLTDDVLKAFWEVASPVLEAHGWKVTAGVNAYGPVPAHEHASCLHALLDTDTPLPMEQASPWSVQNVRLTDYLPMRDDCAQWRRMWLNLQVELINAPFNIEREAQGLPMLNCLWFWGGGSAWETGTGLPKPKSVSLDGVCDANCITQGGNEALNRLVFWRNLIGGLLPDEHAVKRPGTVYCVDFSGWGNDTAVFALLESEVLKPMRMAGLEIHWALLGHEGWKQLQSDWLVRFLFWKKTPQWQQLIEPVRHSGPTEEELERAWHDGQAHQHAIEEDWKP